MYAYPGIIISMIRGVQVYRPMPNCKNNKQEVNNNLLDVCNPSFRLCMRNC